MTEPFELSNQEEDTIKELINIGIGKAANSLSEMTDSKIRLTIPSIAIISHTSIENKVDELKAPFAAANMTIKGDLKGSGFLLFSEENAYKLSEKLIERNPSKEEVADTIKEVTNVSINAVVGTIGNALKKQLCFSVPTYVTNKKEVTKNSHVLENSFCLTSKTSFKISNLEIVGNILIIFDDNSVKKLKKELAILNDES